MHASLKISVLLLACAVVAPASAQDDAELKRVWGGGPVASSVYSGTYVPRIIEVLSENRLSGYTWGGESAGTVANAAAVSEFPTNLAVGQWDILQSLNGQPIPGMSGHTYDFTVLAQDIGPECLYMVTDQDGYSTWGHVLGNAWDMTIATGSDGSGSLATLEILQGIYPDLLDANVQKIGSAGAIIDAVVSDPAIGHGFFVMRPDPASDTFKKIQDSGLTIVPIVDFELEDKYSFLDLKVAYGGFFGLGGNDSYLTTACTSVALITGNPAKVTDNRVLRRLEATIERVGEVLATTPDAFKPNLAGWRDMFDSLKIATAAKAEEMMEASKVAFEDVVDNI